MARNTKNNNESKLDAYDKFFKRYGAKARISSRYAPAFSAPSFDMYTYGRPNKYMHEHVTMQYENIYEIEIHEHSLNKLLDDTDTMGELGSIYGPDALYHIQAAMKVASHNQWESRTRSENPAVKLAWEKYQLLLTLATGQSC